MRGIALLCLLSSVFCIGRATPPEQFKLTQHQNEVLGKFARQVGADEINILLNDPNDATLPGLPVGDLLYILAEVKNEDKLIQLVKGVGARSTLELILAIKRVGCTRVNDNPLPGQYTFDARLLVGANGMNSCRWQHFHLPNIMVQLLNGVTAQGLVTLIDVVSHNYNLACPSNLAVALPEVPTAGRLGRNQALCPASTMITTQPATNANTELITNTAQPYKRVVDHYSFLMKIAYIAAGFDYPNQTTDQNFAAANLPGPGKLYNLMNLTIDGRDMVFLLDSFDRNACPGNCVDVTTANVLTTADPAGNLWTDITNGSQFLGLKNLLNIMDQVTNTSKMGILVNGYRGAAGRYDTTLDSAQIRYYMDRLRVVLERTTTCTAASYPGTAAEQALQDFSVPNGGAAAYNTKLATMINLISLANTGRMMDLIYYIEDGYSLNHAATYTCPNRGIDNLVVMLNNLNNTDPHINDLTGYNPPYTNLTANTTNSELITAAYLIDAIPLDTLNTNPAKRNKVQYLIQYLGSTLDVLKMACYTAVADNNPIGVATCANRGLVNQVADGSKLDDASAVDLTAAGRKLASLMDYTISAGGTGVREIEDMRFIIRNVAMDKLNGMIKGLRITGTANTASVINQVIGNDCWNENNGLVKTNVTSGGTGYTYGPVVSFGGAATAKAIVNTATGTVVDIVIIGSGTAYPTSSAAIFGVANGCPSAGDGGCTTVATATATSGSCRYNIGTSEFRGFPSALGTGATGLGKLVNVINYITGSPKTVVDLINGVTDGQQLGIMINGVSRSSNLVGVLNATLDADRNNNATLQNMIDLLNVVPNGISRADTYKLVNMLDALGDATEVSTTTTVPSGDHDTVAQLLAPYCRSDLAGLASATCPATSGNYVHRTSGVGSSSMATLISSLTMTGGGGYTDQATITGPSSLNGLINVASVSAVTGTAITTAGAGCTSIPTLTLSGGGGGSGAILVPIMSGGAVSRINILNGGSAYTVAPTITFAGGGCGTTPVAVAYINGVGTITILNGGGPYIDNNLNPTPGALTISGGGAGAALSVTVSGILNTTPGTGLNSFAGGTGYVTGDVCPVVGAGGTGGTCTIQAAAGVPTGCSAIGGGNNYGVSRVVKLGGQAQIVPNINTVTGAVTSYTVVNGGCGYQTTPVITLTNTTACTVVPVPGAVTMSNFPAAGQGRVLSIAIGVAGTGCPTGVKAIIGESPYAYHADGGTAIVNQVTAGKVTSISVSNASINAAQLVQLLDRDATGLGVAINYRPDDAAWPITSACRTSGLVPTVGTPCIATDTLRPNISTREAMVRLLHHGVTPTITSSKSYFNASLGAAGPAGGVAGTYQLDWPGLGPQYLAGAILNNVTSASTQSLITLMSSDTISLEDTIILLGCGDHSTYVNGWSTFTWQQLCTELGPGVW